MIGWFLRFQTLFFEEVRGFSVFCPLVVQILRHSVSAACLSSRDNADPGLETGKRWCCLVATHRPI